MRTKIVVGAVLATAISWSAVAHASITINELNTTLVEDLGQPDIMKVSVKFVSSKQLSSGSVSIAGNTFPLAYCKPQFWCAEIAPIFPDLRREEFSTSVGPVQPRVDLAIPSLRVVIQVKFVRPKTPLKIVINEIAGDVSLYFVEGSRYDRLLAFVWDDGQRSEDHEMVVRGLQKLERVAGAVIVSRPGKMKHAEPTSGQPLVGA